MATVLLRDVAKRFGDFEAVKKTTLEIREGEFLSLLGPSGCGKTTTLRMIAGFVSLTEGRIFFESDDVTDLPPQERKIGMVFQDYALFPHLTIEENIAFGLRERKVARPEIRNRVEELLALVQLEGTNRRYPFELSGGQRQRIALARAIAFRPRVLLMDEPLGALDLKLREAMQFELKRIQRELKITTVFVTHDQNEAMTMSHRIAVMNGGEIVQVSSPADIYNRPRNRFVSEFVGKSNFVAATVGRRDADRLVLSVGDEEISALCEETFAAGDEVTVSVRPEAVRIVRADAAAGDGNALPGRVCDTVFRGNASDVIVEVETGERFLVDWREEGPVPEIGQDVVLIWPVEKCQVFAR
ncbi:MAG: ABC transporter ATP-binding protein [Roseovarius sp.]|nr:ABC transporter ATP-binding protein [Roseovarius sp.]